MAKSSRLDRVYARLLQDHPYGWALFKKFTTRDIHPGVCGYFDYDGDWHTLVDLSNRVDNPVSQGWSGFDLSMEKNTMPSLMTWGPKKSRSISSRRRDVTTGSNIAVAPVEAFSKIAFETDCEEGAVLIAENPVQCNYFSDNAAAISWMKTNTAEMARRYRSIVKQHGIWIVTKTYSARRSAVAVITSRSAEVELGLGVTATGIATLAPESSWAKQTGTSCTEIHEDESGVVLFMSGVYFSQKFLQSELKPTAEPTKQAKSIFRGDWDESGDSGHDDGPLDLEAKIFPDRSHDMYINEGQ